MQLMSGRLESFDTFFLAMAHWQRNEKEQGRKWYDHAVAWMEKNKAELRPAHAEELQRSLPAESRQTLLEAEREEIKRPVSLAAKQKSHRPGRPLASLSSRAGEPAPALYRRPARERRLTMWFHSLLASWKSGLSRDRHPQPRLPRRRLSGRVLGSGSKIGAPPSRPTPRTLMRTLINDITAANMAGGTNTITLTAPDQLRRTS